MNIQSEIRNAEQIIKQAQHKLKILMSIAPGYFFEFTEFTSKFQSQNIQGNIWKYMGRFTNVTNVTIRMEVFACSQNNSYPFNSYSYTTISELKCIGVKDFPLYIGWPWKSQKFTEILSGKSKIRIPKGVIECLEIH